MDGKSKAKMSNVRYIRTQLLEFISTMNLPDDTNISYEEKDNYVEFTYNGVVYAVLIDGENWEETKKIILEQKELKEQESHLIKKREQLDPLTTLYNKDYSRKLIDEFLKGQQKNKTHALMLIDIVNFSTINENLGYIFGDNVLINLADSLKKIFYDTDIVGRIGGDEFIILLKDISSRELLESKAKEIYSIFYNTYTGENKNYKMSCSSGIAVYPDDGKNFTELFDHAHLSLLNVRNMTDKHICFFDEINQIPSLTNVNNYYDLYHITKTRAFGTNNFDKEIIAFAFDIMSRTKDVKSAINLLLSKVRIQFLSNKVCIIEKSVMGTEYNATYLCSKDGIESFESLDVSNNSRDEIKEYMDLFDENGIYYVNNIKNTEYVDLLKKQNLVSFLQCGIYDDGELKGLVSIEDDKEREWTQTEIESIMTITKIISSYLLKIRASDRASKQLYNLKNYDTLTNLPTLYKFKVDSKQLLKENIDKQYAIIYSDINRFKHINDTLGYDVGDKILCDCGNFLSENIEHECIARIGEDNFIILVPYYNEEELKKTIIETNEQFNNIEKARYPGYKFTITSGVSIVDRNEELSVTIDNANIARKSLKQSRDSSCLFFDDNMKMKIHKELEITNNMEKALKNGEFIVYIQPKIGLTENLVVGGEALVRWRKSEDVIIPPNDFIPIFEKNGFIVNLDFYIYEEVLKMMRRWIDSGIKLVPISLNVSRIHLNDENFVNEIKKLVDSYDIPYDLLELELTESIFLKNSDIALTAMKGLRELGIKVSIDDFGSGYSSLNLLKNMSTDVIKLDKEFFSKGDEMHKEEKIIVSSIISMAKQLNLKVISEGVETKNQSDFLRSVSCDMAQGFLFAKPMPVDMFEKLLIDPRTFL
jgi:diguanylate cyclase (GGDEF)-like protein